MAQIIYTENNAKCEKLNARMRRIWQVKMAIEDLMKEFPDLREFEHEGMTMEGASELLFQAHLRDDRKRRELWHLIDMEQAEARGY